MSRPLFSIHICNYNHSKYIPQCFAGIQRQTFSDFEVVITDDGSTDGSQDIIAAIAAKDSRFKPKYFPTNQGLMTATKDVWERASGDYIFGEGADDFILDENFLMVAAEELKKHPKAAGFSGGVGLLVADSNNFTGIIGQHKNTGYISPSDCYREILCGGLFVPGSGSIWRRERMLEIGGFDYSLGPQIDFVINHALPSKYGVVTTSTIVACQRIYENNSNFGSQGGTLWDAATRFCKVEEVMRKWGTSYEGMEDHWRSWRARVMVDAIRKTGVQI